MHDELPPYDAFENQVYNALAASMRATSALWDVYSSLHLADSGGKPSWEDVEESMWVANEAAQFAHTYLTDETGVVKQWRRLEEHPYQGPETVPEDLAEMPPGELLTYVQRLAEDDESAMYPSDVLTAAENVNPDMGVSEVASEIGGNEDE